MFERWLDKTFYKRKYNNAKMEIEINRNTYANSMIELAKQLEEKNNEVEYWKKSVELKNKTLKDLRARVKELESKSGKSKKL